MPGAMTVYSSRYPGILDRAAHAVLNNFLVESAIVLLITLFYMGASTADRILGTRLRRAFIGTMQAASRDRLDFLRKAQVRHVFKKKYGLKKIKIRLAGGSYWLSIPCLVKGVCRRTRAEARFMAKIINERSALKHNYMTRMRNLGVLAGGVDLKFDEYGGGREMGEYERRCLERLREASVYAPKVYGLHRLGGGDCMLVMEYIDGKPLSMVAIDEQVVDELFLILKKMRENGIFHGDVKLDNFMVSNGRVYVFDCIKIESTAASDAAAFDLACLLCALAGKAPIKMIMSRARMYNGDRELEGAAGMIDVALGKSDLDLGEERVKELKASLSA